MEFYLPSLNTINHKLSTSDEDALERRILDLKFDGPRYDSFSTIRALEYVVRELNQAKKGIARNIVVVAPESVDEVITCFTTTLVAPV